MTIATHQGPDGGLEVVARAVRDLMPSPSAGGEALGGAAGRAASRPLPVYHLGLEDIGPGAPLARARQVGWRYVVVDGRIAALADVRRTDGGELRFAGLSQGAIIRGFEAATRLAAERFGSAASDDYGARILEVPALYVSALWLVHADGDTARDVFIPLIAASGLLAPQVYDTDTFVMNLRGAASARLGRRPAGEREPDEATN